MVVYDAVLVVLIVYAIGDAIGDAIGIIVDIKPVRRYQANTEILLETLSLTLDRLGDQIRLTVS